MSDSVNHEIWQVDVGGQVYEASFNELASWVAEGALQPDDRVRRGNLRWIEAKRVPTLVPHFNAKRDGTPPPPVVITVTDASPPSEPEPLPSQAVLTPSSADVVPPVFESVVETIAVAATPQRAHNPDVCSNHADRPSAFLCDGCGGSFCKACPNSFGGSVKICPSCGGLCKSKNEAVAARQRDETFRKGSDEGFGLGDLSAAFAYPFKFKLSLFFGAVMFMFFSLGQGASSLGGMFMVAAALTSFMLANMLTFGVLAHTTDSFSQGKIDDNFMPSFDEFSLWDDVVHPFFLSIGVYISAFGLFFVMAAIGSYMVFSAITTEQKSMMSELEKLPGTHYYDTSKTLRQSNDVNKLVGDLRKQNDERLQKQTDIANGQSPTSAGDTEESVMRANELIQKTQKAQLESAIGKTPETKEKEQAEFMKRFMTLTPLLVVLAGIGFLWGLFYFPAACTVAGYTRSFLATVNPLVGLDTIKRLGFDYVKLLFMGSIILICSGLVGMLLGMIFSPFDMPGFGNLPGKAVGSLFSFYFWAVFSCLIGFMLFKASDRLKLYK